MESLMDVVTDLKSTVNVAPHLNDVGIGHLIENSETNSFALLLAIPSALILLPTGLIPGVSTVSAAIIFFFSVQMALGRSQPWLPERLKNVRLQKQVVNKELKRSQKTFRFFGGVFKRRFEKLFNPLMQRVIGAVCAMLALSIIPLELVPWASTVPAMAIFVLSLALIVNDGLALGVLVLSLVGIIGTALSFI